MDIGNVRLAADLRGTSGVKRRLVAMPRGRRTQTMAANTVTKPSLMSLR